MVRSYENQLPSNKKFGVFFTFVFGATALYFYLNENMHVTFVLLALTSSFFVVTLVKDDLLLPLNKLWLRLGLLLGMAISPIIIGIIFFGLFTPIATVMRLCGRNELKLKFTPQRSHWTPRTQPIKSESFKNQF